METRSYLYVLFVGGFRAIELPRCDKVKEKVELYKNVRLIMLP